VLWPVRPYRILDRYALNRLSSFKNLRRKGGKFDHRHGRPKVLLRHWNKDVCLCQLQDIREITGYLLIVSVNADVVPLTSLMIIRGRTLFAHNRRQYSVFISNNFKPGSEFTVGLRELQLPSLHGTCYQSTYRGLYSPVWRDNRT